MVISDKKYINKFFTYKTITYTFSINKPKKKTGFQFRYEEPAHIQRLTSTQACPVTALSKWRSYTFPRHGNATRGHDNEGVSRRYITDLPGWLVCIHTMHTVKSRVRTSNLIAAVFANVARSLYLAMQMGETVDYNGSRLSDALSKLFFTCLYHSMLQNPSS